jgi:hypothetical protein
MTMTPIAPAAANAPTVALVAETPLLIVKVDQPFDDRELPGKEAVFDARRQREVFEKVVRWWPIDVAARRDWVAGVMPAPTHVLGIGYGVVVAVLRLDLGTPGSVLEAFTDQTGPIELPARPTTFADPVHHRYFGARLLTDQGQPFTFQHLKAGIRRWAC